MSERPLELQSLADVHSPEVVRRALKRFRRRVLFSLLIAGLVVTAAVMVLSARGPAGLLEKFATAEGADVADVIRDGDTRAAVLRAARVDDAYFTVHLVLMVDDLRSDDVVAVGAAARGPASSWGSLPGGDGCLQVDVGDGGSAREVWITAPAGTASLDLDVVAVPASGPAGRAATTVTLGETTEACGHEFTEPGVGEVERKGAIELDMRTLDIPDEIWRDER